jgi:hypothetical protein
VLLRGHSDRSFGLPVPRHRPQPFASSVPSSVPGQPPRKVMSAIERCRTAALGGHVARCEDCPHTVIAYNSCRNRHCPKCQGAATTEWLAAREADLLPVAYFHVVFTLPAAIADIAYHNKAAVYDIRSRPRPRP